MAVEREYSYQGQSNGTAITTSTISADTVTGSGGTHSTTRGILGTSSMRIVASPGTFTHYYGVTARARTRMRFYVWFATLPSANMLIASVNATSTVRASVRVLADGTVDIRNASTQVDTSNFALQTGQWYRFDWDVNNGTGQSLRIYSGANLHTETPTDTLTGAANAGTHDRIIIGAITSVTTEFFVDAVAIDPTQALSSAIWEVAVTIPVSVGLTATAENIEDEEDPFVADPSLPFVAQLNRLAGTTGLAADGAANAWAETEGLSLVGALNAKAGTTGLALAGVLNELAGTTGLAPDGAAAQIAE